MCNKYDVFFEKKKYFHWLEKLKYPNHNYVKDQSD